MNDRWGHETGDALLRHFATAMKAQLRADSDRLYRTGGDEFVVVAPGAELERLSARIAEALANMAELPASGGAPGDRGRRELGCRAVRRGDRPARRPACRRRPHVREEAGREGGAQEPGPASCLPVKSAS